MDKNGLMLKGAMIGDLAGSVCRTDSCEMSGFGFFEKEMHLTESSFYMLMTADMILTGRPYGEVYQSWTIRYPDWDIERYGMNNGWVVTGVLPLAMRADNHRRAKLDARIMAQTYDAGFFDAEAATAASLALHMAATGAGKDEIRCRLENDYGYDLGQDIGDIKEKYKNEVLDRNSCVNVCQHAVIAFLKGSDYMSCISNAVMMGGDSSSIATLTGALAAVHCGIPLSVRLMTERMLPRDASRLARVFDRKKFNLKRKF